MTTLQEFIKWCRLMEKENFALNSTSSLIANAYSNCRLKAEILLEKEQEMLKEYHRTELLKLNKSDVISSVSESEIRLDLDKMLKAKDEFKNIL